MTDTLKPCPFCKREPQQMMRIDSLQSGDENYLAARCEYHTHWMPVEEWNRRSLDAGAVREETVRKCAEACVTEANKYSVGGHEASACRGALAYAEQAILALGQINAAKAGGIVIPERGSSPPDTVGYTGTAYAPPDPQEGEQPTEEQVERAARVIADSPGIDAPKLGYLQWMGLARAVLKAGALRSRSGVVTAAMIEAAYDAFPIDIEPNADEAYTGIYRAMLAARPKE